MGYNQRIDYERAHSIFFGTRNIQFDLERFTGQTKIGITVKNEKYNKPRLIKLGNN